MLASLNHPNIAAIYGLEEADQTKALVMELGSRCSDSRPITLSPVPTPATDPIATPVRPSAHRHPNKPRVPLSRPTPEHEEFWAVLPGVIDATAVSTVANLVTPIRARCNSPL